jgi:hypothetical protein
MKNPKLLPTFVVENIRAVLTQSPLKNVVTVEEYDLKT